MKRLMFLFSVVSTLAVSQLAAQPVAHSDAPAWRSDNIWSKNIELLRCSRLPDVDWQDPQKTTHSNGGVSESFDMFEENGRAYLVSGGGSYLRVTDVTDPRNPFTACLIKAYYWTYDAAKTDQDVRKDTDRWDIDLGHVRCWTDNHSSGVNLHGHTFAIRALLQPLSQE